MEEHLELKSEKQIFKPTEFHVDEVYRFEGASNPDDNSILFAIHTNSGKKGILVDGYGISGGQVSEEMLQKLDLSHRT